MTHRTKLRRIGSDVSVFRIILSLAGRRVNCL
jgi:hypothetical protein